MSEKFLLVGSDPECFLKDTKDNIVSSIGILPGSKESPFKTKNGYIQPDNILAEFNSKPASSLQEFILNHKLIINDLEEYLQPLNLRLDFVSSILADDELLSDPISRRAGCKPDYNAWDLLNPNNPPDYLFNNTRAAGGHLHISFDQAVGSMENKVKFVKGLDLVLGVPSVILDDDKRRREFYGKAGSHRPKVKEDPFNDPYDGIEYRTLSNFWLKSDELMEFIYKGITKVYNNLEELSEKAEKSKDKIINIINSGNSKEAISFCKSEGIVWR